MPKLPYRPRLCKGLTRRSIFKGTQEKLRAPYVSLYAIYPFPLASSDRQTWVGHHRAMVQFPVQLDQVSSLPPCSNLSKIVRFTLYSVQCSCLLESRPTKNLILSISTKLNLYRLIKFIFQTKFITLVICTRFKLLRFQTHSHFTHTFTFNTLI